MSKRSFKGLVVVPGVGSSGLGVGAGVVEAGVGLGVDSVAVHPSKRARRKVKRTARCKEGDDRGWKNTR
jgi:hypothetical protein